METAFFLEQKHAADVDSFAPFIRPAEKKKDAVKARKLQFKKRKRRESLFTPVRCGRHTCCEWNGSGPMRTRAAGRAAATDAARTRQSTGTLLCRGVASPPTQTIPPTFSPRPITRAILRRYVTPLLSPLPESYICTCHLVVPCKATASSRLPRAPGCKHVCSPEPHQ